MKTLEKGPDKIKKICDVLRNETLEPAQKEAQEIIKQAQKQAEHIISEAKKSAAGLHENAKASIDQERNVFQSSLQQAAKQGIETLRQEIEDRFFNEHLQSVIEKNASDPQLVANLINAIIKALERDGLAANLTALAPKTVTPRQVNDLLLQDVIKTLKEGSVTIGDFAGGAKIKLTDKKVTIDISEQALKELLATYLVRKDFRKMIFAN